MTIAEIVHSHAYGMQHMEYAEPLPCSDNSLPSDTSFPETSYGADISEEEDRDMDCALPAGHMPANTYTFEELCALNLKEEYYEDDEEEDQQDQLYDNSVNLLEDYLTRYPSHNVPTSDQPATDDQSKHPSYKETLQLF